MQFLFRSLPKPHSHSHHRTFVDSTIKHVRDRGLDHAVEREKNLKPIHDIKNMIKSEPSMSLPISIITDHRDSLKIPFRPIELIRKYPSVFEEFLPGGGTGINPHIKLTPELLNLDAEENLVYQSENYKQNVANRLLKLLMMSRINKIPLRILQILKWDLGLPNDYVKSVVPEFPDCFRVIGGGLDSVLELVCWSDELAVSVLEKKVLKEKMGYEKGMPIAFPMQFSRDFVMDKKFKKWMDEWQKLPYVSPYENSVHLSATSDESDKWAAGVLHELLHLFVGKKAEKENVLCLGEYLGIRSRFKRVLLHHPGIFYLSSKIGTYTVVLREAYKRGLLIESNPLMGSRNQYLHLMHMVKENKKSISVPDGSTQQQKGKTNDVDYKDDNTAIEDDAIDDDDDDDDEEEEEEEDDESHVDAYKNVSVHRGRTNRKTNLDVKGSWRNTERQRYGGKHYSKAKEEEEEEEDDESHGNAYKNVSVHGGTRNRKTNLDVKRGSRNTERQRSGGKHYRKSKEDDDDDDDESHGDAYKNVSVHGGRTNRKTNLDVKGGSRNTERQRSCGKHYSKAKDIGPPKFSRRTEMHDGHDSRGSSHESRRPKFLWRTEMHGNSRGSSQESRPPKFSRRTEMHGNGCGSSQESCPPKFSRRTEMHGGRNSRGSSQDRSSSPRSRGRSLPDKKTST